MKRSHGLIHAACAGAAALVLLAPAASLAAPRGPHGHHGPRHHGTGPAAGFLLGVAFERLDLSEGQRAEIHDIVSAHHEEMATAREGLWRLRHELMEAGLDGAADEAAIRATTARLAELEATLALGRAASFAELRQVLTPEQRAEWRGLRERMREGRGRFGRGPCPDCPGPH